MDRIRSRGVLVQVRSLVGLALVCLLPAMRLRAQDALDYAATSDDLKPILLDSSDTESFLAVQADTQGRLFVGGREALFVLEPDEQGGYAPRQELYRFPNHTWIYDIAIRGDDIYVLTVSALYVIPQARIERTNLQPKRLVWGVPLGHVHQCFHGMAIGPEGDLYFAMGDPLWYYGDFNRPDHWGYWTFFSQPDNTPTPYTGVGGVFRCRPDGSHLQVVARGLRNSCGLAFDQNWNLFTNDNDHEQMPAQYVPGRLIHVTPHAYFNWPRGWLLSKTPDRADLLETMFEGMGRAVPVGQAYYHDSFLPESYRDNLLVARWCIRSVTRYPLKHRGASFSVTEEHVLDGQNQARPVGVSVGRGGRIFVTIAYMAQNEGSPVYRSDLVMLTRRDDAADHPFDAYDATTAEPTRLWRELASESWSRRYAAHVEILRRGGELLAEAERRLRAASQDDLAVTHLVWLAAAAEREAAGPRKALHGFVLPREKPRAILQMIRALADFPGDPVTREFLISSLKHGDPQVQHAAVLGLFHCEGRVPAEVLHGPARGKDTYLRQASALLLAEKASLSDLARWHADEDPPTRLAATLASGFRLTLPRVDAVLDETYPLDALRSEEAYTIQFADEQVDLRKSGRIGNFTVADHWKSVPHSAEQESLFGLLLAALEDKSEAVRLQAAHFLSLLNDPRSEPAVLRVIADTEEQRLLAARAVGVAKVWLAGPFADGDQGFAAVHAPEEAAIDLDAEYETPQGIVTWQEAAPMPNHFNFARLFGPVVDASAYAFCRLESGSRQRMQLLVGSDDGVKVWHNGQLVWTNDETRSALPFQDVIFLNLEPGSNDILVRVRNRSGEWGMYLFHRALREVVARLPDKVGVASLAERLAEASQGGTKASIAPEFLNVDWLQSVEEGDAEQGRKLYQAAGCVKCHALQADAGPIGGPSLADARKRFTVPYLVESILLPNKQISPVFRATRLITKDGLEYSGLLVGETAEKVELLLNDTKRVTISKEEVESRDLLEQSPMPQGVVKTPQELRDILRYLLDGKP